MKVKSDLIKRKYIDITEDFMNSIFDFFIEKKELKKGIPYCMQKYSQKSFACSGQRKINRYNILLIPENVYSEDKDIVESHEYFMDYLKCYGFNYLYIMKKYEMNFYQVYCMISILHEIGHMITMNKSIDIHGYNKIYIESKNEYYYNEFLFGKEQERHYRNIECEKIADKKAVRLFNKYEKEMIEFFKKIEVEVE
jgi:hypothetical protein